MISIYALLDPRSKEIKYIGQTMHPESRLIGHVSSSKLEKNRKAKWIRELSKQGEEPIMSIIETVAEDIADETEMKHMRAAIDNGCDLLNDKAYASGGVAKRRDGPAKSAQTGATYVRLTAKTKRRLEQIAASSIAPNISDHIRFAVDNYVRSHDEQKQEEQAQK